MSVNPAFHVSLVRLSQSGLNLHGGKTNFGYFPIGGVRVPGSGPVLTLVQSRF